MIIRCPECNKLLFKIKLNGYLRYEIKCPKCNKVVVTSLERNEYNIKIIEGDLVAVHGKESNYG